MSSVSRYRWLAVAIFFLSSTLNMLDRAVLAALAPTIKGEFRLNNEEYGWIVSAFSITYGFAAPIAGLLIDRIGLTLGAVLCVGAWSLAGIATGLAGSLRGLIVCRGALGVAEGGGIPATAKANALYLPPGERALGSALSQFGLTVGAVSAPLLAAWTVAHYNWRLAFILTGALGFVWIPAWLITARRIPALPQSAEATPAPLWSLLRDARLWGLIVANMLLMTIYSLWVNWTTVYFTTVFGMTERDANRFVAWIPSLAASAGGMFGGWLALRWINRGHDVLSVRLKIMLCASIALLSTAAVPLMPSPALATALICVSYFSCVASSVNLYSIPLDVYGAGRAAFAVSTLTSAYGVMQAGFSPLAGRIVDAYGFPPLCMLVAALPLLSWVIVKVTSRR
ncbi:MAG: MFS transporter [Bryobacteraceae bacterium]|nr:MFS transporter [Bryobacteraceae bacterium]